MPRLLEYLKSRGRLILAAAFAGLLASLCTFTAYEPGTAGLVTALAAASGTEVTEFAWEPPGSSAGELLFGRGVLFVGTKAGEDFSEVHRAFVHLAPEGKVLGVSRVRNLSQTDLAAESGLRAHGRHAVFVSESDGGVAVLTVLDLAGERREQEGFVGRLELSLSRYLEQGTAAGLGQCDVLLPDHLDELALHQEGDVLGLRLNQDSFDLKLSDLFDSTSTRLHDLDVMRRTSKAPPLGHWAADVGRSLFGAPAVARLEELALSIQDRFARTGYTLTHLGSAPTQNLPQRPQTPPEPRGTESIWPPADVPSPWPDSQPGEGHWQSFAGDLMPAGAAAPSPLFQTFVRPDPERPYARAHLVAIDTARLQLGLRGGYEDPRPRTGPPGSGHIPDDPRTVARVVATFNGAFKTTHGSYGMKAEGRVLVPPSAGAATVRIDTSGAVGLGAFRPELAAADARQRLDEAEAYRQNLDLLLDGDQLIPTGRLDWGDHLIGGSVVAERSGLCVRKDGHLVYVWAQESTARSLARAMQMAGCERGIHLDMNPGHCTFAAHRVKSFQPLSAKGRVLSPAMKASATRYLRWSPKDFFYLAYRDPFPRGGAADLFAFQAAPGEQPQPPDLPAIVLGQRTVAGILLDVERVDLGRVALSLAIGSEEAPASPSLPTESAPSAGPIAEHPEPGAPAPAASPAPSGVLAAWTLGHATYGSRPGLSQGTSTAVAFDRAFATVVLPHDQQAYIKLPGDPLEPGPARDLIQLEVLARDGALLDHGRRITPRRQQGALCIDDAGFLWLGRMIHDTPAPLAQALLDLGCRHVLEADRGSQSPALVERAGHEAGVRAQRAESALIGTARKARGRAYAF